MLEKFLTIGGFSAKKQTEQRIFCLFGEDRKVLRES